MEFYLVKNKPLKFVDGDFTEEDDENRESLSIDIGFEHVMKMRTDESTGFCKELKNSLTESNYYKVQELDEDQYWNKAITVVFTRTPPPSTQDCIKIQQSYNAEASIFEQFQGRYKDDVTFKVTINDLSLSDGANFNFEANELKIQGAADAFLKKYELICNHLQQVKFPENLRESWLNRSNFSGRLTLTVSLNDDAMETLHLMRFDRLELTKRNRTLLSEEDHSNLEIIAANGAKVKCYKGLLAVSSEVFMAMFGSKMMDGTSKFMDMPDMSEAGVRALLAFIYHWDLKAAFKSRDIALELLRAGHKYAIPELETVMQDILCTKPNKWFNVDTALKLFMFAKNLGKEDGQEKLEEKALLVLKWFNNAASDNIKGSKAFKQLFKEDPAAALDISSIFLAF